MAIVNFKGKKSFVFKISKVFFISFIFLIMCVLIANAAKQSTHRPSESDLAVTWINQEPDPAEPGEYVDLRFKFDNNGTDEAKNVEAELLTQYPFSLEPGADAARKVGTLQSMQRGDVGVIIKYRVRIDRNAIAGENGIKIRYRINGDDWIEPEEFKVDIQTRDAILSVENILMGKETFEPGSKNNVKIMLSNKADSILRDVKAKLDLGNLPFVPLGSTNEKSAYQIGAREGYEFDFSLLTNPDADSGYYQVPLKITYSDNLGKSYTTNGTIGFIVGAKPEISVTIDESEIFEAEKSGAIVFKVVNKGVTNLKFVNLKMMPSNDYTILSNDEVYLGNIDSDDFETADFKLFLKKTKNKIVKMPLVIEYKDANNNNFRQNFELNLNLYTASEAKKFGLKQGNGYVGVLIVLIIVGAGLFYYIRHRKKKKA